MGGRGHVDEIVDGQGAGVSQRAHRSALVIDEGGYGALVVDGGVAVDAGEGKRARALLHEGSRSRNGVGHGHGVGAVEGEGCVVGHGAGAQRAGGPARTDLQGSRSDRGGARVAIGAGEHGRARAHLVHRARSRDGVGHGHGVGAVEGEGSIVDDGARAERSRGPACADLERRSAVDGGGARVGVCACQCSGTTAGKADCSVRGVIGQDARKSCSVSRQVDLVARGRVERHVHVEDAACVDGERSALEFETGAAREVARVLGRARWQSVAGNHKVPAEREVGGLHQVPGVAIEGARLRGGERGWAQSREHMGIDAIRQP